jgi:hypothetical protein
VEKANQGFFSTRMMKRLLTILLATHQIPASKAAAEAAVETTTTYFNY